MDSLQIRLTTSIHSHPHQSTSTSYIHRMDIPCFTPILLYSFTSFNPSSTNYHNNRNSLDLIIYQHNRDTSLHSLRPNHSSSYVHFHPYWTHFYQLWTPYHPQYRVLHTEHATAWSSPWNSTEEHKQDTWAQTNGMTEVPYIQRFWKWGAHNRNKLIWFLNDHVLHGRFWSHNTSWRTVRRWMTSSYSRYLEFKLSNRMLWLFSTSGRSRREREWSHTQTHSVKFLNALLRSNSRREHKRRRLKFGDMVVDMVTGMMRRRWSKLYGSTDKIVRTVHGTSLLRIAIDFLLIRDILLQNETGRATKLPNFFTISLRNNSFRAWPISTGQSTTTSTFSQTKVLPPRSIEHTVWLFIDNGWIGLCGILVMTRLMALMILRKWFQMDKTL